MQLLVPKFPFEAIQLINIYAQDSPFVNILPDNKAWCWHSLIGVWHFDWRQVESGGGSVLLHELQLSNVTD